MLFFSIISRLIISLGAEKEDISLDSDCADFDSYNGVGFFFDSKLSCYIMILYLKYL